MINVTFHPETEEEEDMSIETLWKSLKAGIKSDYDDSKWEIGKWRKEKPPEKECVGLNASQMAIDAMVYVPCEVLAKVEVQGKIIKGTDKWTCERMRIVEAYEWTKEESVRLSIFAAELCLSNFEKEFPGDDRPRKAIEAAKYYLDHQTDRAAYNAAVRAANRAVRAAYSAASAARAANSAARSAYSASRAACSAVRAANRASRAAKASRAAYSATYSAARAAESAVRAAYSAASSAARNETLDKIEEYIQSRVPFLKHLD